MLTNTDILINIISKGYNGIVNTINISIRFILEDIHYVILYYVNNSIQIKPFIIIQQN